MVDDRRLRVDGSRMKLPLFRMGLYRGVSIVHGIVEEAYFHS